MSSDKCVLGCKLPIGLPSTRPVARQDSHLILHILFLENSKSVTLMGGGGGWGWGRLAGGGIALYKIFHQTKDESNR